MRINKIQISKLYINKLFQILFLCLLAFSFVNCQDSAQNQKDAVDSAQDRDRDEKDKSPIRTEDGEDYFGEYDSSDYTGDTCDELEDEDYDGYRDCEDICDKVFDNDSDECERLPVVLIEDLEKLYNNLLRIKVGTDGLAQSASAFDFGVMIDISIRPVEILIDEWNSERAGAFLIWVASSKAVALALEEHDKDNELLEEALEKFGDSVKKGLSEGLRGSVSTFFSIAEDNRNKAAFVVGHKAIEETCSTPNCKKAIYCVREELERRRRDNNCHYNSNNRRASRDYCYTHGPNIWSYLHNLVDDRDISDSDFDSRLDEEACEDVCRSEECNRDEL